MTKWVIFSTSTSSTICYTFVEHGTEQGGNKMLRAKYLTQLVTGLALVGLLTGCGGSSASSQAAKSATDSEKSSNTQSASQPKSNSPSTTATKTDQNKKTAVTTKPQQAAKSQSTEGKLNSSLGSLMNMDEKTMQKNVQSGKSLAEIAKSQGVSEEHVIDTFVKNLKETLDKNVASGKLTQTKEDQMLSDSRATFKKLVEQKSGK
jgi:hypothetical protein